MPHYRNEIPMELNPQAQSEYLEYAQAFSPRCRVSTDRPDDFISLRLTSGGFTMDLTDERCWAEFGCPWWKSPAPPCDCGGSFASGHHNVLVVRRPSREVGQQQWTCSRTGKVWVVQIGEAT